MDRGGWWASPWVCKESDTTVSLSHAYVYVYTHTHYICQTYILCIQIFVVQMMVLKSGF